MLIVLKKLDIFFSENFWGFPMQLLFLLYEFGEFGLQILVSKAMMLFDIVAISCYSQCLQIYLVGIKKIGKKILKKKNYI